MASSFEAFAPPGLGGTTEYPATTSSYHSGGSYGTVFVVLAVILVVSAVACVMGRFCGKSSSKKNKHNKNNKNNKINNKAKERERERDVEFGFGPKGTQIDFRSDSKIPKGKVAPNGHGNQGLNGPGPGHFSRPPMANRQVPLQLPMMECPRN